ncbi:MAG: hypothetical protein DRG78_00635 [Epsilonproteobacteria bacterium]|nr:MAG: hypothetical protein DRG78_00635 [Campylobacterota bacterium]
MNNMVSKYTQQQLELISDDKLSDVLSSILIFDNYTMDSQSIMLETKMEVEITNNQYLKVNNIQSREFESNIENTEQIYIDSNIEFAIDKLTKNRIEILKVLYNNNLDLNKTATELNKDIKNIEHTLKAIAEKLNYLLNDETFEPIDKLIQKNKILSIEDLPIKSDHLKQIVFVLVSVKEFKLHYKYDNIFNAYILHHSININEMIKIIYNYSTINNKEIISSNELKDLIPYPQASVKVLIIAKLTELDIVLYKGNNYHINYSITTFDDEINSALRKLSDDYNTVLKLRIIENRTLQEVANIINKTRERIRQIEKASIKKLYITLPRELIDIIKRDINDKKILPINNLPIQDIDIKKLISAVICHREVRSRYEYNNELESIILNKEYSYKALVAKIIDKSIGNNSTLLPYEELVKYTKEVLPGIKPKYLINALLDNNDLSIVDNKYFFHTQYKRKRDMAELIYQLSDNGYETAKDTNTIKKLMNKFFPNEFVDDSIKNIISAALSSGNVILWDWGRYIHTKHIQYILNEFNFTDVIDYLNINLENATQVDLNGYFKEYKSTLINFGIISKYALHSLLKIKFPDDFSYQDSPWVSNEGTARQGLGSALLSAMNENKIYTLDELSNKLQTRNSRIQQLMERQKDIIIVDTFTYIKKTDLNFPMTLLKNIIDYIDSIIEDLNFIYIDLVVDKFRLELNIISQYNKESVLLDLLKKCTLDKKFNINNTRIIDSNYPITRQSLNFHYIIENNLLNQTSQLDKNSLFNYFTSRGLSSRYIMLYYLYSKYKTVVRKDENLFILISSIGLDNVKIEKLNILILENLEDEQNVEDLLIELQEQLPFISLPWNKYILGDLLDNDLFEFYPNRAEPVYIKLKE